MVITPSDFMAWEHRIKENDFVIDFECQALERPHGVISGFSIATLTDADYVPIIDVHNELDDFSRRRVELFVEELCKSPRRKIAHNMTFDYSVMKALGHTLEEPIGCTLIAAFNHDCDHRSLKLHDLCQYYNAGVVQEFKELVETNIMDMSVFDIEKYSTPHARSTMVLHNRLEKILRGTGGWSSYSEIDIKVIPSVYWIESSGIKIDEGRISKLSDSMFKEEIKSKDLIYSHAGREFDINSSQQMGTVFHKELGLPVIKRTKKTNVPCMDKDTMEKLSGKHPIVDEVLKYREVQKLRSTFVDGISKLIINGRVHTSLHMDRARSGRFSSSKPNLQNIPNYDKFGIRNLFIADEGNMLSAGDYSQIEMRLVGIVSGDKELLDIYARGDDVHGRTCQNLFGEITDKLRRDAKTINFGVGYGMGAAALGNRLGISAKKAQEYLNAYWQLYSGWNAWNKFQIGVSRATGYTKTIGGRRRLLPDINSSDKWAREGAEMIACNHVIQGSAAEILKIAQTCLYEEFKDTEVKCVLTVHDELVLECPKDIVEDVSKIQKSIMENLGGRVKFCIPLEVEVEVGPSWGECH
jgi:DNA polymerase I